MWPNSWEEKYILVAVTIITIDLSYDDGFPYYLSELKCSIEPPSCITLKAPCMACGFNLTKKADGSDRLGIFRSAPAAKSSRSTQTCCFLYNAMLFSRYWVGGSWKSTETKKYNCGKAMVLTISHFLNFCEIDFNSGWLIGTRSHVYKPLQSALEKVCNPGNLCSI